MPSVGGFLAVSSRIAFNITLVLLPSVVAANHMGGYAGPPAMSNRANLLRKQELLTMEFKRRGNKEMPHTVIKLEAALKGDKSKGTKGRKAENKVEAKVAEAL